MDVTASSALGVPAGRGRGVYAMAVATRSWVHGMGKQVEEDHLDHL
mgnify:CR=1 FL=1